MLFNRWAYFIFVAFILLCNDQKASSPVDTHPASTQRDIASCCGVQIPICPKCFHTMHPNSFNGRQYLEPRPVVRSWLFEVWPRDKHMVVLKLLSSIHPFKGLSGCGYVVVMPDGGFSAQNLISDIIFFSKYLLTFSTTPIDFVLALKCKNVYS